MLLDLYMYKKWYVMDKVFNQFFNLMLYIVKLGIISCKSLDCAKEVEETNFYNYCIQHSQHLRMMFSMGGRQGGVGW